ncbi:MAG: 16S rRNA (uracil(1498)-N(3))-methyltransferase [Oligoflexia bacterium]|nr:16S rRNA (uracil(1498)-N(3))-methyltransferase [Oligoflexia bacterium]
MNRIILLPAEQLESDHSSMQFKIERKEDIAHIQNHLKAKVGDELKVTVINHGVGLAKISAMNLESITFEVTSLSKNKELPLHIISGLSRPPTMKKVIEHGISLGVKKITFFQAQLSEKSYADSKIFEEEKLQELILAGLAQEARTHTLPVVEVVSSLKDLDFKKSPTKLLLSLDDKAPLLTTALNFDEEICIAIGPERGWTQSEEEFLINDGFQPTKISTNVLRVEIALFSFLGQIHHNYLTNN